MFFFVLLYFSHISFNREGKKESARRRCWICQTDHVCAFAWGTETCKIFRWSTADHEKAHFDRNTHIHTPARAWFGRTNFLFTFATWIAQIKGVENDSIWVHTVLLWGLFCDQLHAFQFATGLSQAQTNRSDCNRTDSVMYFYSTTTATHSDAESSRGWARGIPLCQAKDRTYIILNMDEKINKRERAPL